jgi:hypothetical protein
VKSNLIKVNRSHLPTAISAKSRTLQLRNANQFKVHEDGGVLFCSTCNVPIDHLRMASIKQHGDSVKHKKREECVKEAERKAKQPRLLLQKTVEGGFKKSSGSERRET